MTLHKTHSVCGLCISLLAVVVVPSISWTLLDLSKCSHESRMDPPFPHSNKSSYQDRPCRLDDTMTPEEIYVFGGYAEDADSNTVQQKQ
jgi:hypothetical protein